jgi:FKBP-type peptidyl-prolyl cis-trans isomerase
MSLTDVRWLNSRSILMVLGAVMTMTACGPSPTAPLSYAPFSTQDLVAGTGAGAETNNVISVHYSVWLYDGAAAENKGPLVESNVGSAAFTFTLGAGAVIPGWDQGLVGMQVGGLRRLVVPPSLAYGRGRSGSIPPNSTLVFDVSLDAIN